MKYTVLRLLSTATSAASDRSHRLWIALKGLEKRQKQPLLKEFKSVKRIKEASLEEIAKVIGEVKAQTVKKGLSNE